MKLNKRTKRIFAKHKASYLGMLLLIILSSSCYLGFKTATVSIEQNVQDSRIRQNLEDANFSLAAPLDDGEIADLEKEFSLTLQRNESIELENGYDNAILRLLPRAESINLPEAYSGDFLKGNNEVMVDRYFLAAKKLELGDKLELFEKDYTITGTFTTPDFLSLTRLDTDFMADGNSFGLVLMTSEAFDALPRDKADLSYSVVFTKDNEDDFRRSLGESNRVTEWTGRETNSRITNFDSENLAIVLLSIIAPLFILVVSSIIMAVVLSRMLKQEYTYIGTLTAMGYRKKEIFRHYLRLPGILSIAGAVLGLGLGFLLIDPFSIITGAEYNIPRPQYFIEPLDVVLVLIAPLLLNLIFCSLSVAKALRLNIVALLKASGGKEKPGWLTKAVPKRGLSFKARFRLKEIASNIPRSLLMLVGIIAASLFMLTGFLFYSSIDFLLEDNLNDRFGYKYQYFYEEIAIGNETDGESFMLASFYADGKDNERINFTVHGTAGDSDYIQFKAEDGSIIDPQKTIVTQSVARRMGWEEGDTIAVTSNASLEKTSLTVDAIADIGYGDYVFMPMEKVNGLLGLPDDTHIGLYSKKLLDIDSELISDVLTREDTVEGLISAVSVLRVFLYILGGVAAVVSLVVVYIVTIMLIEENRRNISMLKVMGYQNKSISRLLLRSTSSLVWLGFIVSIPITLNIIGSFFDLLTANMFLDFSVNLKWWHGLLSFGLILLVYYATLAISKRKVFNIDMAESLRARE